MTTCGFPVSLENAKAAYPAPCSFLKFSIIMFLLMQALTKGAIVPPGYTNTRSIPFSIKRSATQSEISIIFFP